MEQYPERLNSIFQALADPTRRAVLGRLSRGPASISELAKPFDMALPSFMKHIRSLEDSGWILTRKAGRVRTCAIEKKAFATRTRGCQNNALCGKRVSTAWIHC
jgi:DNA-binding transcriptional ArsR family regulator